MDGYTDDLPYANRVAEHLGVSLNVIDGRNSWVDSFDKMIWQLDEPQADLAPINVSVISRLAKSKDIKVLIGGAGGDDVFNLPKASSFIVIINWIICLKIY